MLELCKLDEGLKDLTMSDTTNGIFTMLRFNVELENSKHSITD